MAEVTKTDRKGRVERLSEWEDARYSIIPADAPRDLQLTLVHFRLLGEIGRVNTKHGWCEFSQKAFAAQYGIARQTASLAINDLVRWRYVEMRDQKKTRTSLCHYRVLIDDPYFEAEAEHVARGERGSEGGVSGTGDTPPGGGCQPEVTPVSATGDTPVSYRRHPHIQRTRATRSKIKDHSPPTPRKRGARAREDLIEEVRSAKPHCRRAIDNLLAPLLARIRFDAPNKSFAIATLAEWIEKQSDDVIAESYRLLTTPGDHHRGFNVRPTNIEDAIREARKIVGGREAARNGKLLFKGTPEFDAMLAKVAEQNAVEAAWLKSQEFVDRARVAKYLAPRNEAKSPEPAP